MLRFAHSYEQIHLALSIVFLQFFCFGSSVIGGRTTYLPILIEVDVTWLGHTHCVQAGYVRFWVKAESTISWASLAHDSKAIGCREWHKNVTSSNQAMCNVWLNEGGATAFKQLGQALQQYGYLVMEFSDESNFVSQRLTFGDAIRISSPISLIWWRKLIFVTQYAWKIVTNKSVLVGKGMRFMVMDYIITQSCDIGWRPFSSPN